MNWRERRRREQHGQREAQAFPHELPAVIAENCQRLKAKGGWAHPEIPYDPRPRRPAQ